VSTLTILNGIAFLFTGNQSLELSNGPPTLQNFFLDVTFVNLEPGL
jgi:hypothetical protein